MTLVETLPLVAAAAMIVTSVVLATRPAAARPKNAWALPLILCGLFFAWSLYAILTEGPTGFWPEHTRNLWGNQIWFDLLIGIGAAWALLVPRARAQNMVWAGWLLLILCTGSIGLLAMLSRLFFLEERALSTPFATPSKG